MSKWIDVGTAIAVGLFAIWGIAAVVVALIAKIKGRKDDAVTSNPLVGFLYYGWVIPLSVVLAIRELPLIAGLALVFVVGFARVAYLRLAHGCALPPSQSN
jgi:hypothetical protein